MWKVIEGPIGDKYKENLQKEKIVCLCWYEGGARYFYNSKRDILSVQDLSGLKISIQNSQRIMDVYSYLGVSLVPTKPNDIYGALQKRYIDGIEDNIISYYSSKYYEVAKYVTYDAHSYIPELIIASRTTMIQLPKSDQELIEEAARESAIFQRNLWKRKESEAIEALKKLNVSFTYVDDKYKNSFFTSVKPFYDLLDMEYYYEITNAAQ